ncbi:MAG: DsbA family oxidoreductase [Anaerolineales bacterium]|nr:DsbA family oxidoreductase [Anaerolineales bacterium]
MVERLKQEYNVEVDWRPYYLRPDTPPEGLDLPDYIVRARANGSEERLRAMAELHGMEFKSTERILNTRLAHEATEYARDKGKDNEFHHIVFRKVYGEGQDISKWDVLRAAAEEAGLDADDMQTVVESGTYTAEVAGQVQRARQIGVTGVPTYVINDKYAIVGAQPYEAFKNALAQIMK